MRTYDPNPHTLNIFAWIDKNHKCLDALFRKEKDQMFQFTKEAAAYMIYYFVRHGVDVGLTKLELLSVEWDYVRIHVIGAYLNWRGGLDAILGSKISTKEPQTAIL
jgi:hypothetical protein